MFYRLVRPTQFRLPPVITHELAYKAIIWWDRGSRVWSHIKDWDYWIVVLTTFAIIMMTPPKYRMQTGVFCIDVAIALRAGLPRI